MKQANLFSFPKSTHIRYLWRRGNVTYHGIMQNPRTNRQFQLILLQRKVSAHEVISIEPLTINNNR